VVQKEKKCWTDSDRSQLAMSIKKEELQWRIRWEGCLVLFLTAQNVILMLVLYHEHNDFAKIKFLGLFK
jgi:hypothetical protein